MKDAVIKVSSNVQVNKYVMTAYKTFDDFPTTGNTSSLYLDLNTNFIYYWNGQMYCIIYSSGAESITFEDIDSIINNWEVSNE